MTLSIRLKLQLLLLGFVVFLGGVSIIAFSATQNSQIQQTVSRDVKQASAALERFIAQRGQELSSKTALIADLPTLKSAILGSHDNGATVRQRFDIYNRQLNASSYLITDDTGATIASGGAIAIATAHGKQLPGVLIALGSRSWTGVVDRSGQLFLGCSVPVIVGGYVKATVSAFDTIDSAAAAYLSKSLGSDVAFISANRILGSSIPITGSIREDGSGLVDVWSEHREYIGSRADFPGYAKSAGTGIVSLMPYDLLVAPYRATKFILYVVLVVAIAVAVVAARTVAGKIAGQIDGLVAAAETVCAGQWPEPLLSPRTDEIGLLQRAFNDMTASIRESQDRLLEMIDIDPLTELANYRSFMERMDHESALCRAATESLALCLLDVDKFSEVNSQYGHSAGDETLKAIAKLLAESVPVHATVGRFDGDTFAILLPYNGLDEATAVAEHIVELFRTGGAKLRLTSSVGCAELTEASGKSSGLLLSAELALGRAKQLGRDRVCRFDTLPGASDNDDPYQLSRYLEDGSLATIQALAAAVDAKDAYTRGHSTRVAEYARDLALFLGMSVDEAETVYRAGTLHDVGKIGVPDAILSKPGKLEPDELAVMQTHPVLGDLIVRKVPLLEHLLPGVRSHHERWDGKGYPDGLTAESIPMMARLLAVADTFDAMTSDRPYRKGLDFNFALDEIAKGADTQFEADIARSFVRMMLRLRDESVAA